MATDNIREKLSHLISDEPSKWMEEAKWRKENKAWLKKSQAIALKVLRTLRENKMKQNELARALGVSDQQISKIVKGKENLTLDTISKLEKALEIVLFELPKERKPLEGTSPKHQFDLTFKSFKAHLFFELKSSERQAHIDKVEQYFETALLKDKAVAVTTEDRKAYPANTTVYEPEENDNYKEAA